MNICIGELLRLQFVDGRADEYIRNAYVTGSTNIAWRNCIRNLDVSAANLICGAGALFDFKLLSAGGKLSW